MPSDSKPNNPISGKALAVLGSVFGCSDVGDGSGAGVVVAGGGVFCAMSTDWFRCSGSGVLTWV